MSEHVYKHVELTGSSKTSMDDAIRNAIARAARTLRNMHWFEVTDTRGHIVDGDVAHWQVTVKIGFTIEDEDDDYDDDDDDDDEDEDDDED